MFHCFKEYPTGDVARIYNILNKAFSASSECNKNHTFSIFCFYLYFPSDKL